MDIKSALEDAAVVLASKVAELLAVAVKDLQPEKKQKILEMIETDLPLVISNTLFKTTALHSEGGIKHLKDDMDAYAEQFTRMFLRND